MKILILLSCALAASQAGFASPYYYPQQILLNGAPVDTPEVQLAKAIHFDAHAKARYGLVAPLGHYGLPLAHNALPLDTPEVAAAKAQHFHDYAVAAQRNGVNVAYAPLVASGHPVDTPEVQLAKAAHFAAHAEAAARSSHGVHYRRRRAIYPLHYPVIDHNGVPVETPEVQAARAHHFAEYAKVASRPGQSVQEPVAYGSAYAQPYQVPAVSHNGVPLDTPEVQAARANHFAALSEASGRSGQYSPVLYRGPGGPPAQIGPDGQPLETYEVQAAKAAHFAAYAAVRSGNPGHYGHY